MAMRNGQSTRRGDMTVATNLASSNSTLNMFLGGKQKSWMTEQSTASAAPLACAASGRPGRKTRVASGQENEDSERLTSGNTVKMKPVQIAPRPLSTSTSPQLANLGEIGKIKVRTGSTPINIPPSPAPSEDCITTGDVASLADDCQDQNIFSCSTTIRPSKRSRLTGHGESFACASPISSCATSQLHNLYDYTPFLDKEYNISLINKYVEYTMQQRPLTEHEAVRLRLLESACSCGDYVYLTLHQLLCIRTTVPQQLPRIITTLPSVGTAWDFLQRLLPNNEQLPANFLEWATSFPTPIPMMAKHLPTFATAFHDSITLMQLAPFRWNRMLDICRERKTPPLVRELVEHVGITSMVLQCIAFAAIRRSFWGQEGGAYVATMDELFHDDQQSFHTGMQQHDEQSTVEAGLRRGREQVLIRQYKELFSHHLRSAFPTPPEQQLMWRSVASGMNPSDKNQPQAIRCAAQAVPNMDWQRQQMLRSRTSQTYPPPVVPSPLSTPRGTIHNADPQLQNVSSVFSGQMLPPNIIRHVPQLGYPASRRSSAPVSQTGRAPVNSANLSGMSISPSATPRFQSVSHPTQELRLHGPQSAAVPWDSWPPLIPARGWKASQPAQADPTTFALHQATLRSPLLGSTSTAVVIGPAQRLFQYVEGFALAPQTFSHATIVSEWSFNVLATEFEAIPRDAASSKDQLPMCNLKVGSRLYRLRCVRTSPTANANESARATTETHWPVNMYFQVNSLTVQPRRKLHYGKDLPIDVSHLVSAGTNTVKMLHNRNSADNRLDVYACAVENIGVASYELIKEYTSTRLVPAAQIMQSIKASLSSSEVDEDVAVVSSSITINLFDPISGCKIFDIPVRGKDCKHRDCFDLETFLSTRKSSNPGGPSIVDCWNCPICKGDVRPQTLIIDGFLIGVRQVLADQGSLHTRAIVLDSQGMWKKKVERNDEDENTAAHRSESAPAGTLQELDGAALSKSRTDVIDLDD